LIKYTERLTGAGVEPSVGSVGDSFDNALAETVNGLYKTKVIRRRGPWRSLEAVEFASLEWMDWFNHRRLLEPIGNIPPAEAEHATMPKPRAPPWRRDSTQPASGKPDAVQGTMSRYKRIIGNPLRSHSRPAQEVETRIAVTVLDRMLDLGRPQSVRAA
jgi:hypothetical protein